MLIAVAALLAVQAAPPAAPTLGEIQALPPERAGERLLAGRTSTVISAIETVDEPGPAPPGFVQIDLVEAPRLDAGTCGRRRWRATFRYDMGEAIGEARFDRVHPMQEVALPLSGACAGATFAHVNPGISLATAAAALRRLRDVAARPDAVEFACSSSIDRQLCAGKRATAARLAATPAWAVSGTPGAVELWLGAPGQPPIVVELDSARPDQITVSKEIPPPF